MNLKEFLRPTRGKVILWFVLFLFLPFPYYDAHPVCIALAGIECKPYWSVGIIGAGTVIDLLETFSLSSFYYMLQDLWMNYLLVIFASYMLSSLIIFVYNRFKNKK